jgi:glycosyltransferase involved in cell wall biosynthesis
VPEVSVVVAARNAGGTLPRLLAALRAQTVPHELVVVDDGSCDGSAALATVRRAVSGGAYVARNDGVRVARGRVVAFTDADCVPALDWLERLLAVDSDVVAGAVAIPLGPRPSLAALVDAACGLDQERYVARSGFGVTANLLVRRAVLDAVGPFNARLRSGGDSEWCLRAGAAGATIAFAPDAVVDHAPRAVARELVRKGLRVGRGLGDVRRVGSGPAVGQRRRYLDPRLSVAPIAFDRSLERLAAQGIRPGPLGRARLAAGQVALVQLPTAAGQLAADAGAAAARLRH